MIDVLVRGREGLLLPGLRAPAASGRYHHEKERRSYRPVSGHTDRDRQTLLIRRRANASVKVIYQQDPAPPRARAILSLLRGNGRAIRTEKVRHDDAYRGIELASGRIGSRGRDSALERVARNLMTRSSKPVAMSSSPQADIEAGSVDPDAN